jgi:Bromodomain
MDLGTMGKKLDADGYSTFGDLLDDFQLIMDNCARYNRPGDLPSVQAAWLDVLWNQAWVKARKMSREEAARMKTVVTKLWELPT